MPEREAIPINLLTGFLGSGKTTLLNHMLRSAEFSDCAVLVNEFGEVGVDHHLIESVRGDVVLLQSGCICCTVRGDLSEAIRSLYEQREAGSIPSFHRMVIETTGLADPVPVLSTIMHERVIQYHFRVGNVITTVDAVNAANQFDTFPEAFKQIAVADRIVITKTDLVNTTQLQVLHDQLKRWNPGALILDAHQGEASAQHLLGHDIFDPKTKAAEVARWLAPGPLGAHKTLARPSASEHAARIRSFVVTFERQMNWTVFGVWLSLLLQAHGDRILRVKGLLNVQGSETPVVVHGVQHLVHPPSHLAGWPTDGRQSQLVFITLEIEEAQIRHSLEVFQHVLAAQLDPAGCGL
jgi:G3E family GTPase